MLFKPRMESTELLLLKCLNKRMNLSVKDKQRYYNLKKGYEGEVMFDLLTEKLACDCMILNDLLLKINNTIFQIDSLIIMSETIFFFEVKNFNGDYYYESNKLYTFTKSEVLNPLHQLGRSESLLRQLLDNLGCKIPIDASVVFINPEFTLYQAPLNKPYIYPTQVNRYLQKLHTTNSKLNGKHKMLAEKLYSLHLQESPFQQLPSYDYDGLRKGITCVACHSFSISEEGKKCICTKCGKEEEVELAVMRNVDEFKLLFPDRRITTNIIHEWCKSVNCKRKIRRILEKNFKRVGVRQWTFYE